MPLSKFDILVAKTPIRPNKLSIIKQGIYNCTFVYNFFQLKWNNGIIICMIFVSFALVSILFWYFRFPKWVQFRVFKLQITRNKTLYETIWKKRQDLACTRVIGIRKTKTLPRVQQMCLLKIKKKKKTTNNQTNKQISIKLDLW